MRTAICFALTLVTTLASPALAQTRDQNVKWCTSADSTADLRIGGCTALIRTGQETASDMAIIFADRGLGYFDKKEYLKAKDDFDQSLRLNANGALAIGGRARVMAIQKQFDAAFPEHVRAISLARPDELAFQYWLRGMTNLDAEKYPASASDFNQALAIKPAYAEAFFQRGRAYFAQGDYTKAIADNTESLRLDTTEYTAYYNRGLAYARLEQFDKAVADFDALLKINPGYTAGRVERAHAHMSNKDYPRALADLNEVLAQEPTNQEAVFTRARVYYTQKSYDLSITDNTTAIALDPADHVAYSNRGLAYKAKADYPKALADFDKALALKADYASAQLYRAQTYQAMKKYDEAIDGFSRVVAKDPKNGDAFYYRSQSYEDSNRVELALADASTAVTLQPGDISDLELRARLYQRLHLFQLADGDFAAVLKIDAGNPFAASEKALNRTMLSQVVEAVADCKAILAASPANHSANEACGMVYLKASDWARAIAAFENAMATGSETDAQPIYGRGLARMKLGQTVAGKADLDKAIALQANVADLYSRFGLVR